MKIGPFGLWMLATVLVGGTFMFTQISHLSEEALTNPPMNKIEPVSVTLDKQKMKEIEKEYENIKKNAPFYLIFPNEENLSKSELTGAFLKQDKDSPNKKHVDFFYKTPQGDVHIWQSNIKMKKESNEADSEKINIENHQWNYDKVIGIFTTQINGTYVQLSGQGPKDQLLRIISGLDFND